MFFRSSRIRKKHECGKCNREITKSNKGKKNIDGTRKRKKMLKKKEVEVLKMLEILFVSNSQC